jgi:NAD(P)-dependent dehydrogenase (short-subunit alcohol dehydrogenase family)
MDMLLKGKRALITGSTSGIGAQCARVLAGEGVSVVINGRNADRAAAVTEEIRKFERDVVLSALPCRHLIDADPVPEADPAQEARAKLLAIPGDVAAVGYAVGYDSPSQFSREYRRLFGAPPGWDTARLQETSLSASPVYNLFSDATGRTADDGNLRN